MTKFKTLIFALVVFASVFLLGFAGNQPFAFGNVLPFVNYQNDEYLNKEDYFNSSFDKTQKKPWDTEIIFKYTGKQKVYRLSQNLSELDKKALAERVVFCNSKLKARWLKKRQSEGIDLYLALCYIYPGLKDTFDEIKAETEYKPVDATITFLPNSAKKFSYTADEKGCKINVERTCDLLLEYLTRGDNCLSCQIPVETVLPSLSLSDALKATSKRGEFVTDCFNSSQKRQNNIALALKFFNGVVLEKGETKSFNEVVGKRTADRGFSVAKVLLNGSYVDDVGGGVCQASTTLFNALVLSDISIKAVCQHSVKSSYVLPSFDAMVTDTGADLVFCNNTEGKIYIATSCINGKAKVEIFGYPKQYEIKRRSVVMQKIPFKTNTIVDEQQKYVDKVTYVDEQYILTAGVDGIKSQGWLDYIKDGKIVFSKQIRTNYYKPIDMVVVKGSKTRPQEITP